MSEEMIPQWTLGDRLRKARVSADIDADEMAALFFRHRNTIGNWEGGHNRPTKRVLTKWAEVTKVPLWWLLGAETADAEPASNDRRSTGGVTLRALLSNGPRRAIHERHLAAVG